MQKDVLLNRLQDSRQEFLKAIAGIPEEAMPRPGVVGEWSMKDLLAHLTLWEAELVKVLWQARQGEKPSTVHFSRLNVDDRNAEWFEANRERPLERVLTDFHGVRKQTIRRVEAFTDQELNDPRLFPWLSDAPLVDWIENDSYGHEEEHMAEIRSWREQNSI